jgi:VWFA-related protein
LRVALVSAPVVVTDASEEPVLDLHENAFHVVDNGVEQTIEAFDLGGEPLSAVLVFETSSRVAPLLPAVRKSAIVFTQTVVGPSGEAAILSYDYTVGRLLPFTMDHDTVEKTISGLKAGNSGMRLYDALSQAVELLSDRSLGRRRAIIVVGEASDGGSEKELGEVLREAQLANVMIYCVGLSPIAAALRAVPSQASPLQITPSGTFGSGPTFPGTAQTPTSEQQYNGNIDLLGLAESAVRNVKSVVKDHPLEVAATGTGGTFQSVEGDRTIDKAVDAIGGELNSQYILSYRPVGSDIAGYHQIKVTVDRPGTKVRTRPGYYLEEK